MRKFQQKQLLELVKTLNEAYTEIKQNLLNQNLTAVIQLLSDSQDFVIQIGRYIENIEGEGTQTVTLLEEFHEALYQVSLELSNDTIHSINLIKQLEKQIKRIDKSIHNELKPNKIEVVFLSYKASMFDAFESIWKTAKNDPHCDAYVIPIPYFEKLPGSGFGKLHYEGNQYPDYVPVVDFRTYDIESRHPDIIFIHNPYDGENYATSVHPDYYSKRLKNYTDLLVYVPYFVVSDDVSEHFCTCAGVLYADKVFVQSEKIQDTYVRVFKEFEKKYNCRGRFGNVESKFVASGSPKFDKVRSSKPADFNISPEWRRLIERPDGTLKRIVLYNTSVGAILQGNEQYIKKLKYVLETFRKYDDVLLWWRPHPLNDVIYKSMRPQLLREYEQIIADYKREGWGIFDDTTDLHRSICLSSMYYGDRSSLVALYQCTGKPILIQDINFTKYEREATGLIFDEIIEDKDYIWFVSAAYNALFKMDKNSWSPEKIGEFPNESVGVSRLYRGMAKCGSKLYFAPLAAKEAAVFDISSGQFSNIQFRNFESRLKTTSSLMFYNAISYKHFIYFLPLYYPAIIRLDTENGEQEYYCEWINTIEKAINSPERGYFYNYCLNGNILILPCANTNAVIQFNLDSGTSRTYILGECSNRYVCACFDGIDYWLCSIEGSIYRWNEANNVFIEVASAINNDQPKLMFIDMFYMNGYIWVFPYKADFVIRIDVSNYKIEKVDVFENELIKNESNISLFNGNFIMSVSSDVNIYTHTGKSNHLIEYNTLNGEMREEAIIPDEKTLTGLRAHYYYYNGIYAKKADDCNYAEIRNINFGINEFLNYFIFHDSSIKVEKVWQRQAKLRSKEISNADASAGMSIYNNCKNTLFGK